MTSPLERPRRAAWWKDFTAIAAAATVVLIGRSSLADHYYVPTESMLPTVAASDHILVDKAAYSLRIPFSHVELVERAAPEPGDVVVLESPETGIVLLKRVVAGPGDVVQVESGRLLLNGHALTSAAEGGAAVERLRAGHHVRLVEGGGPDFGPVRVPDGHYLVLGDNRGNSRDGRFFGFVPREAILGRAVSVLLRRGDLTWLAL